MLGLYLHIKISDKMVFIMSILFICIGIGWCLDLYGFYDYMDYTKNRQEYCILNGVIVDIQEVKKKNWRTIVYCNEKDKRYELATKKDDVVGEKVMIGVNKWRGNNKYIWLKPYIPKEPINIGTFSFGIGIIVFNIFVLDYARKSMRKKLIFATVLYKKRYNWKSEVLEYAVCSCYDDNGKQYLLETESGIYPIELEVKDELLVLVNPKNYKNYEFVVKNGYWIKRRGKNESKF